MLGSRSDAEDIVQDAYLRFAPARQVRNAEAFLVTVVTRLCLDALKSARARRETYVGPWFPEPIATNPDEIDPESVSLAFLTLLERLLPLCPNLRAVTFEDPRFDAAGQLLTGNQRSWTRIVETLACAKAA